MINFIYIYIAVTFGILLGIIFVLHGWRRISTKPELSENPTFKNFMAVVGGSAFMGILERFQGCPPEVLEWYLASLLTTIIIFSLLILIGTFFVYRNRLTNLNPDLTKQDLFFSSLEHSVKLVLDGLWDAGGKIEDMLYDEVATQSRYSISTLAIIESFNGFRTNDTNEFLLAIELLLEDFIQLLLEKDEEISEYRGCLYFYQGEGDDLKFLVGVAPEDSRHQFSRINLQVNSSLAGYALNNPSIPLFYPFENEKSDVTFQSRNFDRDYKAVMSLGVEPYKEGENTHLVLCIDCIDEGAVMKKESKRYQLIALGEQIAILESMAGITQEKLFEWIARN